jgi:hypothetical protein
MGEEKVMRREGGGEERGEVRRKGREDEKNGMCEKRNKKKKKNKQKKQNKKQIMSALHGLFNITNGITRGS